MAAYTWYSAHKVPRAQERAGLAAFHFPGLSVTIEQARFGSEMAMPPGDHHVVAFNVARVPVDIHACYISSNARSDYRRFGPVSFVPAGVGLHMVGKEAGAAMLMCRFESRDHPDLSDNMAHFDIARLERCTDIRNRDIVRALERIAEEARNPGLGSGTLIGGLAATLAVDLARLAHVPGHASLSAEAVRQVERYCAGALQGRPLLADAAALCGLSERHFAATLKQATGQGFHQFVASLRLRQARQLLAETALPIKEVSYRCGFSHVSSFSSAFREAEGITPHRYRTDRQH